MDYNTPEDHGDSPWASSPQATVTSFQPPPSIHDHPEFAPASPEQSYNHSQDNQDVTQQDNTEDRQPQPSSENVPAKQPPKKKDRPLYKLQAKITSLERNGRKDPIIKFDVYVSILHYFLLLRLLILQD
jgi:hypothetical protein